MKVLVIGNDPKIFNKDSENFIRIREYADLFDELHIISFTQCGFKSVESGRKLFLYPTNTFFAPLRALDAYRIGKNIVKARKIDFIDAQDPSEAGLVAYMLSKSSGIRFCIQIHADILSPRYRRASWKEGARFILAKFLIPRANCIRAVSERIKMSVELKAQSPKPKIFVLPIFTDISKFVEVKPDARTENRFEGYDFKMVAVGRLVDKEKNFLMLIGMMKDFVKTCPKALLVIVGDGPDRKRYESATRQYGLEKSVIIERWREDLPSFLKSFDLFLMPSNHEGWGRAVIEAMAAGLPVIMTDVGLAGEVVINGMNGIVVPVLDKNSFLRAMEDFYQNPEKRKRVALAGETSVLSLSPKTKDEYLKLYAASYTSCP